MKNNRFKNPRQKMSSSKGEKELFDIIHSIFPTAQLYYDYPVNRLCDVKYNIRFDLYCPTYGIVWEIDGNFHHAPVAYGNSEEEIQASLDRFKQSQLLDRYKEKICEENEIKLIRIPQKEWDSFKTKEEKREFIMGLL